MVLVLPNNDKPSALHSLIGGLAQAAPSFERYFDERTEKKQQEQQAATLEKLGIPRGIKSPELIKALLSEKQSQASNRQKEETERAAAKEAGYTYGAPPAVAAEQVKAKSKGQRLSQYGLTNEPSSSQNPSNIAQPNKLNNIFKNTTDDDLILAAGAQDREISEPAKAELKSRQERNKEDRQDTREKRKEQLEFHKESKDYDENLTKNSRNAKTQLETLKDIEKSITSGNVKPTSLANIFKGFGKIGNKISEALLNKDESALLSSIPQLLEGWKEVFGVRLSDADLKLLQDKLPSIGKSPDANLAVTKILRKYSNMTLLRENIARDIKQKNQGLRPLGYADQIEQRFDEMTMPVKIVNPNNGNIIDIPAYQLSDALQAGAKLANE